jgi:capsular exopolysaccharide synthesis family protein
MTPPIVKRYLIAFDQHKWTGLAACTLVICASGVVAFGASQSKPETSYIGTGAMMFVQPAVLFSNTGTEIQRQAQVLSREALLTKPVLEIVGAKVRVKPEELGKNLKIELPKPPEKGQAAPPPRFGIVYVDNDKDRTEMVVKTLMTVLKDQSRVVNSKRLKDKIDEINKRIPQAQTELRNAEQKLEQYVRLEGPMLLAAQNGSLIQSIGGSQGQQRAIQFQLQGVDAQLRSLQQRLGLTPSQAYSSSALSADPIIANLRSQIYQTETQIKLRGQDLKPTHPDMITLATQKAAYEKLLQERAAEVITNNGVGQRLEVSQIRTDSSLDPARQQLAQQLVALDTQQQTLAQQLKALQRQEFILREQYRQIPNKQLEQARLQQQVKLRQDLYDRIQASLVDAKAAEVETVTSLEQIEDVDVKSITSEPQNPVLILGAGVGVGFAVGAGLIFLLGSMGGILQTMEDIRAALTQRDIEVLGILPVISLLDPDGKETPILLSDDIAYLEFYERFRSKLRLASEKPVKVVLFTSIDSQEGKSVSAYNLAIASARAGKRTLLIEADLRSPSLAKLLKVASDPDAAVEPLRYYGSLSECIRLVPMIENLYIVPSPDGVRQAASVLESNEFLRLLEDAKVRFDMVILDTPSMSDCNDALSLEPLTDGMILVTRPGYTRANMLAEVADQLTESEEQTLLGAIINAADIPAPRPIIQETTIEESLEEKPEVSVSNGARKRK